MAEVSEVCDHIIIISRGKIVADNSLEELEGRISDQSTLRMSIKGQRGGILDVIDRFQNVRDCRILSEKDGILELELSLPRGVDIRDELFFAMAEKRYAVINMEQITASLEEVFLSLTDKTQGTQDKRAAREKKRRDKLLGNVKEDNAPVKQEAQEQNGGEQE